MGTIIRREGGFPIVDGVRYLPKEILYRVYEKRLLREIRRFPVPRHVAVIMDGNRRFARKKGIAKLKGHLAGRSMLETFIRWCRELGVKVVTVYAFSTENLNRDVTEVNYLMELFATDFARVASFEDVHNYKIRVKAIGQTELLPQHVQDAIRSAEEATKDYDQYILNIAVAYGGRQEIIAAIKKIAAEVKDGDITVDQIDEKLVSTHMYTGHVPDPDLILRTSGEERISNFLLWQLAYSELYFADIYWPEMRYIDFLRAIRSYQDRQRRYGT